MKKLIVAFLGLAFIGMFYLGVEDAVAKQSEFIAAIHEINILTDKSVDIMGNPPTLQSVNQAKQFIDEHKDSIREKLQKLRNDGRLGENSDEAARLEFEVGKNKEKIAIVYNDFVYKAKTDIKTLDEDSRKMMKAKKSLSENDLKILEGKLNNLDANNDVIAAMDDLMKSYKMIFEKNK